MGINAINKSDEGKQSFDVKEFKDLSASAPGLKDIQSKMEVYGIKLRDNDIDIDEENKRAVLEYAIGNNAFTFEIDLKIKKGGKISLKSSSDASGETTKIFDMSTFYSDFTKYVDGYVINQDYPYKDNVKETVRIKSAMVAGWVNNYMVLNKLDEVKKHDDGVVVLPFERGGKKYEHKVQYVRSGSLDSEDLKYNIDGKNYIFKGEDDMVNFCRHMYEFVSKKDGIFVTDQKTLYSGFYAKFMQTYRFLHDGIFD